MSIDIDPRKLSPGNDDRKGRMAGGVFYTEGDALNSEALIYVSAVRRTKVGKVVTLDEVLACPDPCGREWKTPERLEALQTVIGWQSGEDLNRRW